jgi:hypothetical protein
VQTIAFPYADDGLVFAAEVGFGQLQQTGPGGVGGEDRALCDGELPAFGVETRRSLARFTLRPTGEVVQAVCRGLARSCSRPAGWDGIHGRAARLWRCGEAWVASPDTIGVGVPGGWG